MFISALEAYIVVIMIAVVAVQYAFALFCLTRLAYIDITKREYVLWNLCILLVFFIGGAVFLVYYSKIKDEKRIPPYVPPAAQEESEKTDGESESDGNENVGSDAEAEQPKGGEALESGEE